ncbi:hypothetical protein HDV00_011805 [Rhizophlyctis rosea]|nr:hypothetical protein HDV00_011805 [Rhizophlyctis rosea]
MEEDLPEQHSPSLSASFGPEDMDVEDDRLSEISAAESLDLAESVDLSGDISNPNDVEITVAEGPRLEDEDPKIPDLVHSRSSTVTDVSEAKEAVDVPLSKNSLEQSLTEDVHHNDPTKTNELQSDGPPDDDADMRQLPSITGGETPMLDVAASLYVIEPEQDGQGEQNQDDEGNEDDEEDDLQPEQSSEDTGSDEAKLAERIDVAVSAGRDALQTLKSILQKVDFGGLETRKGIWADRMRELETALTSTKTVIAVVGNTGGGKSSVINALLDHKNLVPTNGMRACTSVVTEISYNKDNEKYEADIEFLSEAEWRAELEVLLKDIPKITSDMSADQKVSLAKIKAVYSGLSTPDILDCSVDDLLKTAPCPDLLGTTETVVKGNSRAFISEITKFVDSKDKVGKEGKKNMQQMSTPQYWPLIRRVRIRVRAEALRSGAIIVDLPGVQDSNAARASIAKRHMQKCDAVWVLAPINRAVDDKSARDLLGETFRRQLLMDGGYSNVTFICSKTDDILPSETAEELDYLQEPLHKTDMQFDDLREQLDPVELRIEELRSDMQDVRREEAAAQREATLWWERSRPKAFLSSAGKRKADKENDGGRKKRKSGDGGATCMDGGDADGEEDMEKSEILEMLMQKHQVVEAVSRKKTDIQTEMDNFRNQRLLIEDELAKLEKQKQRICALARNDYSKERIQSDFVEGLKELDDAIAQEEDPENWDPSIPRRNYDDIPLRVFTVSSRDYMKSKKLLKDGPPTTFDNSRETEIPALQAHTHHLTIARFLQGVKQFIESVRQYLEDDGTLDAAEQQASMEGFHNCLKTFSSSLESLCADETDAFQRSLEQHVITSLEGGARDAADKAPPTSERWVSKPNKLKPEEGGYAWNTSKAVCKYGGEFNGIDFNSDLTRPMQAAITGQWDKTFATDRNSFLLQVLNDFKGLVDGALKGFFAEVNEQLSSVGDRVTKVSQRVKGHVGADLTPALEDVLVRICESQKEISRLMSPAVQKEMKPAYDVCAATSGTGTWAKMKQHMNDHITRQKDRMFHLAARAVIRRLEGLLDSLKEEFCKLAAKILKDVEEAYSFIWEDDGQAKRANLELRQMVLVKVFEIEEEIVALMEDLP